MIMRLPVVLYIVVVMLLLPLSARSDEWHYIVEPGDNLWTLTERFLPDIGYVKKLQRYNSIQHPYQLPPGSTVRIPLDWLISQLSSARVVVVEGETSTRSDLLDQDTHLTGGEQLGVNDIITTGDQSSAIIEFEDGSRVLLHNNSKLILKKIEQYPDAKLLETELLLENGRIETEIPKKAKGQSVFKITTPSATSAVRGTILRTNADKSNAGVETMRVEVLRGRVSVSGSDNEKTVYAGYGVVIPKGKPPGELTSLLVAPQLKKPAALVDRLSALFTWNKVDGSRKYRVQVFNDAKTPILVWNMLSDANRINVPDLADGHYTLKVRGIDVKGLEGKESVHQYTMDARPEPPLPASPDENENIESKQLQLRWSALDGITGYHLQLSNQKNFNTTLIDQVVEDVSYTSQLDLQPGIYYWRIATQIAEDEGPFSDRQQFRIIPLAPQALEPQGDDEHLIFRWQKGEADMQYHMQVAQDEAFTNVVLDKQLSEPRLELDRPTKDRLYLRMRPVTNDGFKGNWSTTQYVDPPANKPWYLLMLLPLLLLILLI